MVYEIIDSRQCHAVVIDKILSVHKVEKQLKVIFVGPREVTFNMDTYDSASRAYEDLKKLL